MKRLTLQEARKRHIMIARHEELLKRDGITEIKDVQEKDLKSISSNLSFKKLEKIMQKVLCNMRNTDYVLVKGNKEIIIVCAHFFVKETSEKLMQDIKRAFKNHGIIVFCNTAEGKEQEFRTREMQIYSISV